MKTSKKLVAAVLVLALLSGCGGMYIPVRPHETQAPDATVSRKPAQLEKITPNGLVLRLLELECAQKKAGNVILSPLSIEMALGMAANGADGEAKASLETLLGLNAEQLNALLGPYTEKGDDTLSIANSMWFNERLKVLVREDFKDTLSKAYAAGEGSFSLGSKADAAKINSWVSEKTHGKIDSIIDESSLSDDALALLINALYFNGKWAEPFEDYQVVRESFHGPDGKAAADFMTEWLATYFETEWGTGFAKKYEEGYEFIALLPKAKGPVDLSGLDIDAFLDSRTGAYDVQIKLPKFELEYATSLKSTLKSLGLGSLFDEEALNAMLTDAALAGGWEAHISDVLHKTYMKMYEEGTEAAAVTAVAVAATSAAVIKPREQKQVFLDRPFAFLIRDTGSGQMVFCGVINSVE